MQKILYALEVGLSWKTQYVKQVEKRESFQCSIVAMWILASIQMGERHNRLDKVPIFQIKSKQNGKIAKLLYGC